MANTTTCYCEAYAFPHRWESGACESPRPVIAREAAIGVVGTGGAALYPEEKALDDRDRAADMKKELGQ